MDARDKIIEDLRKLVARQSEQIAKLTARVAELELALAKAKKDSSTSSKPPSSDITKPKTSRKPGRRGKPKRGGQAGHQQHLRENLPPERVDATFDYEITDEDIQRFDLKPTDEFETYQFIELPESPVFVTEHRLRVYLTDNGERYMPDVGDILNKPIFGPRLLALIGWLKSGAHCSYSTIETYMEDVLQVPVSRGYLAKLCTGLIADSLDDCYQELKDAIPQQEQLGSDETSFKNNGRKHWIWCIASAIFTVFHIAPTRSRNVLEKLVGVEFAGYLNFDYFSANCSFAWNFWIKAQYCWAHLIRDIRFLKKLPDEKTKVWAEQLEDRSRRLFQAWHSRDTMTVEGFRRSMMIHRDRFLELVRQPPSSQEAMNFAARFAMREYIVEGSDEVQSYDLSEDYFRFMFADGVEPTNNHNEQQIRQCVIDRMITQGTRSEAGQRYHERMWTALATCRKQQRNFFEFLKSSIEAKLSKRPAPSLLHG
jgi:transposase